MPLTDTESDSARTLIMIIRIRRRIFRTIRRSRKFETVLRTNSFGSFPSVRRNARGFVRGQRYGAQAAPVVLRSGDAKSPSRVTERPVYVSVDLVRSQGLKQKSLCQRKNSWKRYEIQLFLPSTLDFMENHHSSLILVFIVFLFF